MNSPSSKPAAGGEHPLVAVIDSGVATGHPHLDGLALRAFSLDGDAPPLDRQENAADRTGHGTACVAALYRANPQLEVLAIRLLDEDLRTTAEALAETIRIAADEGARIINLSLGSGKAEAKPLLEEAIRYAAERSAHCVAAAHPRGRSLWPADLPTVISAVSHRSCPLRDLYRVEGPLPRFLAHGYPRPIEGRPPTANLYGPSFAAVHLSARVAQLLASEPQLPFDGIVSALESECSGAWVDSSDDRRA